MPFCGALPPLKLEVDDRLESEALCEQSGDLNQQVKARANADAHGYGVDPDIEVDNDPKSTIEGRDPQLERGIAEVMARLKQPVKLPSKPPGPVKTIR